MKSRIYRIGLPVNGSESSLSIVQNDRDGHHYRALVKDFRLDDTLLNLKV